MPFNKRSFFLRQMMSCTIILAIIYTSSQRIFFVITTTTATEKVKKESHGSVFVTYRIFKWLFVKEAIYQIVIQLKKRIPIYVAVGEIINSTGCNK